MVAQVNAQGQSWTLMVEKTWTSLFHPSTTVDGKFYDAIVVSARSGTQVHFFPVYNYGPGAANGFRSGQVVLDRAHATLSQALFAGQNKIDAKTKGGYAEDHANWHPVNMAAMPHRVQDAIQANLNATGLHGRIHPDFLGGTAPKKKKATTVVVRSLTKNAGKFEEAAVLVLGIADPETALKKLQILKGKLDELRTDVADAESAVEMADLYVQSRLK